jgi:hypothetical protein
LSVSPLQPVAKCCSIIKNIIFIKFIFLYFIKI